MKLHPTLGSRLLQRIPASYNLSYASQTALYHHRWADGSYGYPSGCGVPGRAVSLACGIISIADSLDAGTDNVGRSYAQAKSFDTLVDEIRQGRGSRYDERVAALFDDESFCAQLRDSLPKERESVYCDTYLGKRSASDG